MSLLSFRYDDLDITYQTIHQLGLVENYILDIYRSSYIRSGDVVLDIGAGIGDFAVLASKRVGSNGTVIAIEPNYDDYRIMEMNVGKNKCTNVLLVNMGVGAEKGSKQITFADRTFEFKVDTLESILDELNVNKRINFIKMDIEGFEKEVMKKSLDLIRRADVVSIELHGTREEVSKLLLPEGFLFKPVTRAYVYSRIIQQLFTHPLALYRMYTNIKRDNHNLAIRVTKGIEITKERSGLLVGSYVKKL